MYMYIYVYIYIYIYIYIYAIYIYISKRQLLVFKRSLKGITVKTMLL